MARRAPGANGGFTVPAGPPALQTDSRVLVFHRLTITGSSIDGDMH